MPPPLNPKARAVMVPGLLPVVINTITRHRSILGVLAAHLLLPVSATGQPTAARSGRLLAARCFRHLSVQGVRNLPCRIASRRVRNGLHIGWLKSGYCWYCSQCPPDFVAVTSSRLGTRPRACCGAVFAAHEGILAKRKCTVNSETQIKLTKKSRPKAAAMSHLGKPLHLPGQQDGSDGS